jgi:hypothetical protein
MNPAHFLITYLFNNHLSILSRTRSLPNSLFLSDSPANTFFSRMDVPYTVHLTILDLITPVIHGEEYKLWSYSLRNFLPPALASSLLDPHWPYSTYHNVLKHPHSMYVLPLEQEIKFGTHTKQQVKLSLFSF